MRFSKNNLLFCTWNFNLPELEDIARICFMRGTNLESANWELMHWDAS